MFDADAHDPQNSSTAFHSPASSHALSTQEQHGYEQATTPAETLPSSDPVDAAANCDNISSFPGTQQNQSPVSQQAPLIDEREVQQQGFHQINRWLDLLDQRIGVLLNDSSAKFGERELALDRHITLMMRLLSLRQTFAQAFAPTEEEILAAIMRGEDPPGSPARQAWPANEHDMGEPFGGFTPIEF